MDDSAMAASAMDDSAIEAAGHASSLVFGRRRKKPKLLHNVQMTQEQASCGLNVPQSQLQVSNQKLLWLFIVKHFRSRSAYLPDSRPVRVMLQTGKDCLRVLNSSSSLGGSSTFRPEPTPAATRAPQRCIESIPRSPRRPSFADR